VEEKDKNKIENIESGAVASVFWAPYGDLLLWKDFARENLSSSSEL